MSAFNLAYSEEGSDQKGREQKLAWLNPEQLQSTNTDDKTLTYFDSHLRTSMVFVGLLPTGAVSIKSPCLKKLLIGWQVFIHSFQLSFAIFTVSICWDKQVDSNNTTFILKIQMLVFMFGQFIVSLVMMLAGKSSSKLPSYYSLLAEVEQILRSMNITTMPHKKAFTKLNLSIVVVWILAWLFSGSRAVDYFTYQVMDPIYGKGNESTINSLYSNKSTTLIYILRGLSIVNFTFITFQLLFECYYLAIICFVIWTLFCQFNKKLCEDIKLSTVLVLKNLKSYRNAHHQLCRLLSAANESFKHFLGLTLSANLLLLVLILYLASQEITQKGEVIVIVSMIYYVLISVAALGLILFVCHQVQAQTTEAHEHLLYLSHDSKETLTNSEMFEMQLFLSRLNIPECFTAAGLVNINKDLGLTMFGAILSYFIILIQFEQSSGTNVTSAAEGEGQLEGSVMPCICPNRSTLIS